MRAPVLILVVLLGACYDNRTPLPPDGGDSPASTCFPNLDNTLERSEMPTQLGRVEYLLARDVTVDLAGNDLDLRSEFPGQQKLGFQASELGNFWFADEFPVGSIVVSLGADGESLGILRSNNEGIQLVGIASVDPNHTLLHYQSPIDLYRFPMRVGQSFTTQSAVTGTLAAVPYNGSDRYEVSVGDITSVDLPHLRFTHNFRVHTKVTSDSGSAGVVLVHQQLSLISECFGEIARVVSQDNESDPNFSQAAELWRFSL